MNFISYYPKWFIFKLWLFIRVGPYFSIFFFKWIPFGLYVLGKAEAQLMLVNASGHTPCPIFWLDLCPI